MINHHLEVPFLPLWALPLAFYLCSTSTSDPKPQEKITDTEAVAHYGGCLLGQASFLEPRPLNLEAGPV